MVAFTPEPLDLKSIDTIRALAADVVAKANSGHPGAPMGLAAAAHVLWSRFLKANPKDSKWFARDRFVLSNGCALQYIILHLLGYKLTLDDLKAFRQVDSKTPGHPEYHHTDGVEVTTGPLGQGFSNAVGFAIAEAHLAATFNKEGFNIVDNYTYVFLGDGCLMEGVASEAASIAGHQRLGKLIAIYDDNHITIDGDTNVAFTEDVLKRFEAYGWHVAEVKNGNSNYEGIYNAIIEAQKVKDKPSLIKLETIIGYGSKQQGTHGVHGSPLKKDDIVQLKQAIGFPPEESFFVPREVYDLYGKIAEKGAFAQSKWEALFVEYGKKFPNEYAELSRRIKGELPQGWEQKLPVYKVGDPAVASRKLSETVLTAIHGTLPELFGGSADLTGSNLTRVKNDVDFQPPSSGLGNHAGRYFRYGVREHGMGAILNGLSAYGAILPYGGTFFNFVSYAAGAVRLAALSGHQVIWVATHDSIGLGEDGPTHQPVETAIHFRATPNLQVWRPADGNETSAAYLVAINSRTTPSILCLSRQNLPQLEGSTIAKAAKGGYVLHEVEGKEDLTIVSTGSEVSIVVEAAGKLSSDGLKIRVVSLPSWEIFDAQSQEYRLSVLRSGAPILSVEAYSTIGWERYSHEQFGLKGWGSSGPYDKVYAKFGLTGSNIAELGKKTIEFYRKKGGEVVSPLIKAF
ncbi:putative transketolase [Cantharellus anzutake]|uniref:putative transketolase n=1 Tax=Cantharellus anzutake TaxID=1750568 RepID=UPI0019081772|nr:putative transketolase [Cantharellus anzutake]KAF8326391.1 putative transketolase [Cantharellus anzutake]